MLTVALADCMGSSPCGASRRRSDGCPQPSLCSTSNTTLPSDAGAVERGLVLSAQSPGSISSPEGVKESRSHFPRELFPSQFFSNSESAFWPQSLYPLSLVFAMSETPVKGMEGERVGDAQPPPIFGY